MTAAKQKTRSVMAQGGFKSRSRSVKARGGEGRRGHLTGKTGGLVHPSWRPDEDEKEAFVVGRGEQRKKKGINGRGVPMRRGFKKVGWHTGKGGEEKHKDEVLKWNERLGTYGNPTPRTLNCGIKEKSQPGHSVGLNLRSQR